MDEKELLRFYSNLCTVKCYLRFSAHGRDKSAGGGHYSEWKEQL